MEESGQSNGVVGAENKDVADKPADAGYSPELDRLDKLHDSYLESAKLAKPPKPKNYRQNFWLSISITILSALVSGFLLAPNLSWYSPSDWAVLVISPFAVSITIWIVSLVKKKEGANAWIAGPLTLLAVGAILFGGCLALVGVSLHY